MDKKSKMSSETKIKKHKFHQHKNPTLTKYQHVAKFLSVKRVLNILLVTKMASKLDRYA